MSDHNQLTEFLLEQVDPYKENFVLSQSWVSKLKYIYLYIYKASRNLCLGVCLFVCPIITQKPIDRIA